MMGNTTKRILVLALTLILCLNLLPGSALAEKTPAGDTDTLLEASAEGTDSVSAFLARTIDETLARQAEVGAEEYCITGLAVSEGGAKVTYRAAAEVCLIAAIYDDATGRMLDCATARVSAGQDAVAELTLGSLGSLPGSFYARAFMTDPSTDAPLCDCFTDRTHTAAMQALERSTVEDYDPDRVLNLDEDATTNFVVFGEDVVIVPCRENADLAEDLGGGEYRISAPSEEVKGLSAGDVLALEQQDGMVLLLKVQSISVSGDTVTLTEDKNADLTDAFSVVKLEGGYQPETEDAPLPEGARTVKAGDGVLSETEAEGGESLSSGLTITLPFEIDLNCDITRAQDTFSEDPPRVSVGFTGTGKVSAYVKIYLTEDEKCVEAKITLEVGGSFGVSGDTGLQTLYLVPEALLLHPVPGVNIGVRPAIVFEVSAALHVTVGVTAALGAAYVQDHFENRSHAPRFTGLEVSVEGELYIGFALVPSFSVITDKVGEVKLTASAGVDLTAKEKLVDPDQRHACERCLEGTITPGLRISADAHFLKWFNTGDVPICSISFAGTDYYYSFDYQDHGFAKCPHEKHPVKVTVRDEEKNGIAGAAVSVSGVTAGAGRAVELTLTTGAEGTAELYLAEGSYTFYTRDSARNAYASQAVTVDGRKNVLLVLQEKVYPVTVTVRSEAGDPIPGAVISGLGLETNPTTNAAGTAVFVMPAGVYTLNVSKEGYKTASVSCSVGSTAAELAVTLEEYEYTVTVTVTDENGTLLRDASVRVEELDRKHFTGSAGTCTFSLKNGSYTLRGESVDGTLTGFGELTVQGEDTSVRLVLTKRTATVSLTVLDPEGKPVSYAKVRGTGLSADPATDTKGVAVMELEKGKYTFRVNTDKYYGAETVVITGPAALTMTLKPNEFHYAYDADTAALTLWGGGAMPDYKYLSSPWYTEYPDDYKTIRTVTIEGLSTVGAYTCYLMDGLETVTLPEGLTRIGKFAFNPCSRLTSITLPEGLQSIGDYAFAGTGLTGVTVPDSVTYLGNTAFGGCESLQSITLPGGIKSLGEWVLSSCTSLRTVQIPEGVTSIGVSAFQSSGLCSVALPDGVTSIPSQCFYECTGLSSVTLPKALRIINARAFEGCTALPEILLPETVTYLWDDAFKGCSGLERIVFTGSAAPTVSAGAFSGVTATAYYPATWTEVPALDENTHITWVAYDPAVGVPEG